MNTTILTVRQFVYRCNLDGTTDSICSFCFLTVATAGTFAQLKTPEKAHLCHRQPTEPLQTPLGW
jgi:hypothetical protein